MRYSSFFTAALAVALFPDIGAATSSTSTISGARVDAGAHNIETRLGFEGTHGDDTFRFRQHYDYGFNDIYALRISTQQRKAESNDFDYLSTTLENRFQLVEKNASGWEAGIRFSYTHQQGLNIADELGFLAIADIPVTPAITLRNNTALAYEVGSHAQSGMQLAINHRLSFKLPASWSGKFQLGPELYNDFGNLRTQKSYSHQDHQLGLFISGQPMEQFYYLVAYRTGISHDATNNIVKLTLGHDF